MAESRDTTKAIRADLLIASCALLISTLTAGAAIYQGRIIARQLSAAVWPYISYEATTSESGVQFDVNNVGIGPAIVRGAALFIDGKPESSLAAAVRALGFVSKRGDKESFSSLGVGSVIRAGASVTLARIESKQFAAHAGTMQSRFRVEVCYCSILDQCWLATSGNDTPSSVANCDDFTQSAIEL